MTVLLLRLAGPMQSWGARSRFTRRETEVAPTKSAVLGLLAAARGSRRTDPIEDLLTLRFAVRVDQPGTVQSDFQTAHDNKGRAMPLSMRYYLNDALFVAGVEGDSEFLGSLDHSLRHPKFPLFLGRRSCPPAGRVTLGLRDGDLLSALRDEPWQAARWHRRRIAEQTVELDVYVDADPSEPSAEIQRDVPVSFDPQRRTYGWRRVQRTVVVVPHPDRSNETSNDFPQDGIDFLGAVG